MNILGLARHGLNSFEQIAIVGVMLTAFISLWYAWMLRKVVLKKDKGTAKMQEVWNAIRIGADSYLKQQLRKILPIIGGLTVALFLSVYVVPASREAVAEFGQKNAQIIVAIGRTIAFIMGASFSLLVGQLGMRMAIQANVRAAAAARRGFNEALSIAYYAGTITGMLTDGLGLFGGTLIFIVFGTAAPDALLGFGFGGTLLALFMRVGGGIYTKAADVGADLVGKVEKDIPEDDPRNAAVVADLVGDNVGDCAGMAADIFESYEVTIVSGLILGLALMAIDPTHSLKWIVYPLIIRAIGVISSILGTFTVPIWERFPIKFLRAKDAEEAMFRSYEVSSVNTILWSFLVAVNYAHDWRLAVLTSAGVGLAVAFNPLTSYFTSTRKSPVKEIVKSTKTGPATTILSGLAVGMESSVWAVVIIAISFMIALALYSATGALYVLYGVAMIGIGMLSHTGNNVAMDSYGPISDNANGIAEMAWHDQCDEETVKARQIMADLDAVGNTTKAITKGVAIASAVIAAVSLFASYITDVGRVQIQLGVQNVMTAIRLSETKVFIGLLLGGALPWLFSSLSLRAVTRAAGLIVEGQTRLRPGRRHLDGRGPEGACPAGCDLGPHAAHRRLGPSGRGARRLPRGHHPQRPAPGRLHGQRRRRLGQRQEVDRRRAQGHDRLHRQGLGPAQGRRRRRHGRRPAQGHGRPRPQPDDQGHQPGQPDRGAGHRQVQQDEHRPSGGRGRPAGGDRLGHLEEQAGGAVAVHGNRGQARQEIKKKKKGRCPFYQ